MAQVLSFKTGMEKKSASVRRSDKPRKKYARKIEIGYVIELPDEYKTENVKTISTVGTPTYCSELKSVIENLKRYTLSYMLSGLLLLRRTGRQVTYGEFSSCHKDDCLEYFRERECKYVFLFDEDGWWLYKNVGRENVTVKLLYSVVELERWAAQEREVWFSIPCDDGSGYSVDATESVMWYERLNYIKENVMDIDDVMFDRRVEVGYVVDVPPEYRSGDTKTITYERGSVNCRLTQGIMELSNQSIYRMCRRIRDAGECIAGKYSSLSVEDRIADYLRRQYRYIFLFDENGWWLLKTDGKTVIHKELLFTTEQVQRWDARMKISNLLNIDRE